MVTKALIGVHPPVGAALRERYLSMPLEVYRGPKNDSMGQQKGIYVKDADVPLWQRAEAYARSRRLTMSALLMNALQEYLDRHREADERR